MDGRIREIAATCCRFYKGETECPVYDDPVKELLWKFERHWIELGLSGQTDLLQDYVGEYVKADPSGALSGEDIPPISLKALIFHHFAKSSGKPADAVEPFRRLLARYYRNTPSSLS